jgi:hypothetical protein
MASPTLSRTRAPMGLLMFPGIDSAGSAVA